MWFQIAYTTKIKENTHTHTHTHNLFQVNNDKKKSHFKLIFQL
jgi:hypothetical protein